MCFNVCVEGFVGYNLNGITIWRLDKIEYITSLNWSELSTKVLQHARCEMEKKTVDYVGFDITGIKVVEKGNPDNVIIALT